MSKIPGNFIKFATDILGETNEGLTSSEISGYCNAYSVDYDIEIPIPTYPYPQGIPNKRTALKENILAFNAEQQYTILKDLCELPKFSGNVGVKDLRIKLISRYSSLASTSSNQINESIIEETKHWLTDFPGAKELYEEAMLKFANNIHERNLLDDIRVSLELLLKELFGNSKSLENQQNELGTYISERNSSKELNNMFLKLVDYFCKYQNTYVKHADNVNENEIEIIIEIASSFMKFLIKIK